MLLCLIACANQHEELFTWTLVGTEEEATWHALLERLTSGRQLLISRPFLASGVAPGYSLRLGDHLAFSRSELTRPCIASP